MDRKSVPGHARPVTDQGRCLTAGKAQCSSGWVGPHRLLSAGRRFRLRCLWYQQLHCKIRSVTQHLIAKRWDSRSKIDSKSWPNRPSLSEHESIGRPLSEIAICACGELRPGHMSTISDVPTQRRCS